MRCVICKSGDTQPGTTTVTLEREGTTVVFRRTPARLCTNCGEAYVDAETTRRLIETAEAALRAGVQVDIREFAPSPG